MKSKRTISTFLVVVMVVMVCSTAALAATGHYYKYVCTTNGVNVRNGPSIYNDSYGYLNQGETFWSQHDAVENNFRKGQCPTETAISQAYGYAVVGYVACGYGYLEYADD